MNGAWQHTVTIMYRSNLYYGLRVRNLNNKVSKYSWVAVLGVLAWSAWFYQMLNAIVFTLNRPVITL